VQKYILKNTQKPFEIKCMQATEKVNEELVKEGYFSPNVILSPDLHIFYKSHVSLV